MEIAMGTSMIPVEIALGIPVAIAMGIPVDIAMGIPVEIAMGDPRGDCYGGSPRSWFVRFVRGASGSCSSGWRGS